MKMKKAKVKFIIMLTMMILSLGITFKVMALQSPNLMLSGSENVITDNNAILHATLYNAQAEGINVKAFKWTIYKGKISNNIVVKSIEKVNTAAGNKIEIECNVNKDMVRLGFYCFFMKTRLTLDHLLQLSSAPLTRTLK